MAEKRLMVLGNAGVLLECPTAKAPQIGQTQNIRPSYHMEPIGFGALTAIAAAKLGADVVLATRLGNDLFGRYLLDVFSKNKVNTRAIKTDETCKTGLSLTISSKHANPTVFQHAGANSGLSAADAEDGFLSYPDALLIHLDCSEYTVKAAIDQAERQAVPVFCEPSPSSGSFPLQAIGKLEVFLPNEEQVLGFTDICPDSVDSALAAADKLFRTLDTKFVIIRLGRRGTFIYDGKYHEMIPCCELPLIDERGQDSGYLAALALFYTTTGNITKAVGFANTVSALIGNKTGIFDSLPALQELTETIKKYRILL